MIKIIGYSWCNHITYYELDEPIFIKEVQRALVHI